MSKGQAANQVRSATDAADLDAPPPAGGALVGRGTAGPLLWTVDGVPLATRCWTSESVRGAVVLVHGLTGSKDDPRIVMLAEELHTRGFDVLAYDARGHGGSGGRCTLGHRERHDVAAAVAWAKKRSENTVVIGASLGAIAALSYAATVRDLTGVVAVSSPADWRLPLRPRSFLTAGLARTSIGRAYVRSRMNVRIARWSSPESPRSLIHQVGCPLVAVHGLRDPIIPASMGLGTLLRGHPLRSAVLVSSMGHAFDPVGIGPICEALEWAMHRARSGTRHFRQALTAAVPA